MSLDILGTFIFGLLSSLHCVGMCGGFAMLSVGSKEKIIYYNLARLVSYTTVGFLLGLLGSVISLPLPIRSGIQIFAGVLMIFIAFSMLGLAPWVRKFFPKLPKSLSAKIEQAKHQDKSYTPWIVGGLSGLIPCTPLLAMQIKAVSTGNPFDGALTMLTFGLGTIPLMIIFGLSINKINSTFRKVAFKISAAIIIIIGLLMLNRGLVLAGSPISFDAAYHSVVGQPQEKSETTSDQKQTINLIVWGGYHPDKFTVKKGVPVVMEIERKDKNNPCSQELVIPSLGIKKILPNGGKTTIEFTPEKAGKIIFTCGMGMLYGEINVE